MNIIITGAFGFVGNNLSKANKSAFQCNLTAVDVAEPEDHSYDDFFKWNELDKIDWEKPDAIIHLAGKAHDTENTSAEEEYFDINVGLTKTIFEYFLKSSAEKFIFFSSVKAVADAVDGEYLTEIVIPNPKTFYGRSKLAAEHYILNQFQTFSFRHPTSVKELYILRPCMIHGPGIRGNLNLLYQLIKKGIPWPLGSFENKRSFTSMDNLTFITNQILVKDIEPGIYQIADDEPISINRLIELIAESQNMNPRIWNINKKLIYWVAKLGDLLHLPLSSERLKKLTESYVVSNSKLKKALGIDNMPVSSEDGMKKNLSLL